MSNTAEAPRFTAEYMEANRIEENWNDVTDGHRDAAEGPDYYVLIERATEKSCACGCGQEVASEKRNFLPGHDQRLMGILVRAFREDLEVSWMSGASMISGTADQYAQQVLGDAGVAKLQRYMATEPKRARRGRRTSAAQAAEVIAAPAFSETTVKVGRWSYPGREFANGQVVRNTKRDGSGEWVAVGA